MLKSYAFKWVFLTFLFSSLIPTYLAWSREPVSSGSTGSKRVGSKEKPPSGREAKEVKKTLEAIEEVQRIQNDLNTIKQIQEIQSQMRAIQNLPKVSQVEVSPPSSPDPASAIPKIPQVAQIPTSIPQITKVPQLPKVPEKLRKRGEREEGKTLVRKVKAGSRESLSRDALWEVDEEETPRPERKVKPTAHRPERRRPHSEFDDEDWNY